MTMLISAPSPDGGFPTTSTPVIQALVDPGAASGHFVANTRVSQMHLSLPSTARVELVIGRIEATSNATTGSASRRFDGNRASSEPLPYWVPFDGSFHEIMGRYYFNASLSLNFQQDIEALEHAETIHDNAFAFSLKRLDAATEVAVHVNTWFEVYR